MSALLYKRLARAFGNLTYCLASSFSVTEVKSCPFVETFGTDTFTLLRVDTKISSF